MTARTPDTAGGGGGAGDPYDPADHTVAEVLAYADEHPDQTQALYDAEAAGRNRATLLAGLEAR